MMLRGLCEAVRRRWRAARGDGIAAMPADTAELFEAGIAAATRGDYDLALQLIKRYTARHPEVAQGWNALGNVAKLRGELAQSAAHYRRALELEPEAAGVWVNLGMCLRSAGRTADAISALDRALTLDAGNPEALVTRAAALSDAARYEAAEASLRALLVAHPDHAQAHALLAHVMLLNGRFAEGWDEYQWRWRLPNAETLPPLAIPQWDGSPAPGRLLLLRSEQALGDQIMLASCVPDVAARVGEVWLECDPRLVTLFAGSFPGMRVFPRADRGSGVPAASSRQPDLQIPLGDLPRMFRRRMADFPHRGGYLRADPERVARWRARLAASGARPHIGISWRGGARATRQPLRSIPAAEWAPVLSRARASFVSLQYGAVEDELDALRALPGRPTVRHFPEAIADYAETAALVTALDLVVSVQTAVVHLAGALGRPTWVLVSAAPEWRYMAGGERMPWYDSVRLLRQQHLRDWAPVMTEVARRLDSSGFGDA
jgi:Tfp pilus assembly protein PilF